MVAVTQTRRGPCSLWGSAGTLLPLFQTQCVRGLRLLRSTAHPCLAIPTPTPQASLTLASGIWHLELPALAQGNRLVKCPEFHQPVRQGPR